MNSELLKETREQLEQIADVAYKGDTKGAIVHMNSVTGQLGVLAQDMDEEKRERMLEDALTPILEAMENEDGTMLADIITYELLEILKIS